jgi:hypothetical protein
MKFRILPSGSLLITADNRDRVELSYALRRGARDSAESTVIENARHGPGCGQYEFEFVSGEELCVMTEAPCFAVDMTIEDDGTRAFYGKVSKFEDYMLRDHLEELTWRGGTVFTLGVDFGEAPYKVPPLWTPEYTEISAYNYEHCLD